MKSSTVGLLNKAVKPCLGSQVMVMDESRSFIRPPENTTVLCPRAKLQQLRSLWDSVCLSTSTPPTFTHTSREIVVGSEKCVAISCLAAQREEEAITQTRSLQRDFNDCVLPAFCDFVGVGSPSFTWNFVSLQLCGPSRLFSCPSTEPLLQKNIRETSDVIQCSANKEQRWLRLYSQSSSETACQTRVPPVKPCLSVCCWRRDGICSDLPNPGQKFKSDRKKGWVIRNYTSQNLACSRNATEVIKCVAWSSLRMRRVGVVAAVYTVQCWNRLCNCRFSQTASSMYSVFMGLPWDNNIPMIH